MIRLGRIDLSPGPPRLIGRVGLADLFSASADGPRVEPVESTGRVFSSYRQID